MRSDRHRPRSVPSALLAMLLAVSLLAAACQPGDGGEDLACSHGTEPLAVPEREVDGQTFAGHLCFSWSVADRYDDHNGNGVVEFHSDIDAIQNPAFELTYDLAGSTVVIDGEARDATSSDVRLLFRPDGEPDAAWISADGLSSTVNLPKDGLWDVEFVVVGPDSDPMTSIEKTIGLRDLLIVALGDSYVSGEGNPDVPRLWAIPSSPDGRELLAEMRDGRILFGSLDGLWGDPPGHAASVDAPDRGDHDSAHRSTLAWPSLVALHLERSDDHTTVTYLSLAETGARTAAEPEHDRTSLEEQARRLVSMVGGREVDHLFLSTGSNDAGFSRGLALLIAGGEDFHDDASFQGWDLELLETTALEGGLKWSIHDFRRRISDRPEIVALNNTPYPEGVDSIERGLNLTNRELVLVVEPENVYVVPYPSFTTPYRDDNERICGDGLVARDLFRDRGLTAEERAVIDGVVANINRELLAAAERHEWRVVDGIPEAFDGHGYCAAPPRGGDLTYDGETIGGQPTWPVALHRHPDEAGSRWWRTATEAVVFQNGLADRKCDFDFIISLCGIGRFSDGMLHPNLLGHSAIATLVVDELREHTGGVQPMPDPDDIVPHPRLELFDDDGNLRCTVSLARNMDLFNPAMDDRRFGECHAGVIARAWIGDALAGTQILFGEDQFCRRAGVDDGGNDLAVVTVTADGLSGAIDTFERDGLLGGIEVDHLTSGDLDGEVRCVSIRVPR